MTVNTTNITSGPYAGNGVADTFSYTFRITDKSEVSVYETDDSGVQTLLTVDTDYTVAGIGDDDGGIITRVAGALPTGYEWFIRSNYDETQLTAFESQGAYFPDLHENMADKLTFLIQQLRDLVNRSPGVSESYSGPVPLSLPDPISQQYLRWKSDLSGLENVDLIGSGTPTTSDVIAHTPDSVLTNVKEILDAIHFDNIAELRANTDAGIRRALIIGHTSVGDEGAGLFWFDTSDTTTSDDDGINIVDSQAVRAGTWKRIYSGSVNVKWFGAIGDGVADDTASIQSALDAFDSVFIPSGVFKITSTLTVTPPFSIKGSGADTTILSFEDMTSSTDGISIQQGGNRTISTITDMVMQIKGANGRHCITSPRGTAIFNTNTPTYQFERLWFRGEIEQSLEGLYDYGWDRYLDIGDGVNHVIRDVFINGIYDYRVDPGTVTTDSTIGIFLSGVAGEGGVLTPTIDHVYCHYVGIAVQFDYQLSNPFIVDSQFHRCYRGIHSPRTTSGSTYGVLEAQFDNLNINAQLACVFIAQSAYLDITSVRCTRADGGFDHSDTWHGFKLENVDGMKIIGSRALNAEVTVYTNTHIGMLIENCDFVYISGYNAEDNLDRGIIFHDSTRVTCIGATFRAPAVSSIYFQYTSIANPEIAIINDRHTSATPTLYAFDGGISRESIEFIGGKTNYSSVDDSITGISASGGTDDITVTSNNQILRRQMNTSSSNHTFDLQNEKAREGDTFIFRIQMVAGFTGTVSITPNGGGAIWSKTGPGSATQFIVECTFTESSWILIGAYESDT